MGVTEPIVAEWEAVAATVLRKMRKLGAEEPDALVWERLSTRTLDGLTVPPLGLAETANGFPPARRNLSRLGGWDLRVQSPGGTAALDELETGATSLWLQVEPGVTTAEFGLRLEGVLVDLAPIVLDAPADPVGAARAFCAWVGSTGVNPAVGTNLGADPIGSVVAGGLETPDAAVREIADLARAAGVLGFVVDATIVHDRGASDAQEVGYSLAVGTSYLRQLTGAGLGVDEALALLEFRYAATDGQFPTIAKLRAARQLWARVGEVCGAAGAAPQRQHAVTSRPMMTKYEPWVNLLRTTVATFAAGVGGADAITVLPFDSAIGQPDDFARRIARNTSSLLISESHVATVADPAAGAYAVEQLTTDLAEAAWDEFGRIEASGGVLAAFGDGSLPARISEVAAERARQVASRQRPITGVSEFPYPEETLPARTPRADGQWDVASYAAEFEALRDQPLGYVYLVTMGRLAEHNARAGFATNLFGAGGILTGNPGPLLDANDVLSSYDSQPLVCLVGSDAAYAEWGAEAIAALRGAGARHVMLLGKPGDLEVDDSFSLGDDVVAFLRRTREAGA